MRRFCSKEDREIPLDEVGHAYELENGKSVVVTDEELQAVAPRRTRTIDIEAFVDAGDIDPVHYDHPYFLAPVGESEGPRRAYQLLLEAMRRSERVALGRFVMRTKEYLVAIRVRDDRLALSTMLFGDEIRPAKDIETGGKKPGKQELERAVALIEALSDEWNPDDFEDCYRARLEDVIARKRKGKRISAPKKEKEPAPVPDLMAALERSLAEATGGARGKRGLDDMSRDELYEQAQEQNVPGRSSMSKEELVEALNR